jgi:ribosomal protein S21
MAKKPANVSVNIKQTRGNVERMIRRFIKKTKKERIIEQVRDRKHYKKPSIKKREKRRRAINLRRREEQKALKARQRRNRKN